MRSRHITARRCPSSVPVVSQMRSFQVTGDDQPLPQISVFHRTFFVSLQAVGIPSAFDVPSPRPPRNWFHSGSAANRLVVTKDNSSSERSVMGRPGKSVV